MWGISTSRCKIQASVYANWLILDPCCNLLILPSGRWESIFGSVGECQCLNPMPAATWNQWGQTQQCVYVGELGEIENNSWSCILDRLHLWNGMERKTSHAEIALIQAATYSWLDPGRNTKHLSSLCREWRPDPPNITKEKPAWVSSVLWEEYSLQFRDLLVQKHLFQLSKFIKRPWAGNYRAGF